MTSDLSLRAAIPDDLEAIATVWHRGWIDGHLGHVPDALLQHAEIEEGTIPVPCRRHKKRVGSTETGIATTTT